MDGSFLVVDNEFFCPGHLVNCFAEHKAMGAGIAGQEEGVKNGPMSA